MNPRRSHPDHSHKQARMLGAFTLIELMVTLAIIVIVLGFLASALGRASQSVRQTASQRSVEAIAVAVEQFRLEFGFLPPLVHDGGLISQNNYTPIDPISGVASAIDGPLKDEAGADYNYQSLVVWSEGYDYHFFRRRAGDATDEIEIPSGGAWDLDTAWDDRRYSRYALAYYLAGALPRSVDGVEGQGMTRPLATGGFANVGYPIGGTRDNYQPTVDTDRRGLKVQTGYANPIELAEHGVLPFVPDAEPPLLPSDVYDLYDANEQDRLVSLVDSFGTAYRYYRWEHGRYDSRRRLVVESSLDLNIPPVLLDPEVLAALQNDDSADPIPDLTNGNLELRQAKFAIVGAGADRLFGTEPIEYLIEIQGQRDPGSDPIAIAKIRKLAMEDNVVAYGR